MSNYFKQNYRFLLSLFLSIIALSCSKEVDVFEELSRYEDEDTTEEVVDDTESEDSDSEESTEDEDTAEEELPDASGLDHPVSGAYYVTTNGSSSNDGKSEAAAWDLQHAVANAQEGDVVYIKAGDYYNLRLDIYNSGTVERPIIFMGYRDVPGDIDASIQNLLGPETRGRRGTTLLAGGVEFDYKSQPNSAEMPRLRKDYVRDEMAIRVFGDNVEIQNLIISGYSTGIHLAPESENPKIWNCIFHEQGNLNVGYRDTGHPDRYKGNGVDNSGSRNANIQFCSFLNAENNALQFEGANSGVVSNNVVYSYNFGNGTDYMFLITNENGQFSENLVFEYNKCERVPGVSHGGHGFIVKNGAVNNTFRYWEVLHTNIETNFANVYGNLFEKGTLRGGLYDYGDDLTYILITNGAHDNTFKDIVVDGTWGAVVMHDYDDGASADPNVDANAAGSHNKFINLIAKNCRYGVIFSETGANSQYGATDNVFMNCTFYNVEYGVRSYMTNSGTAFYNTTFNTTNGLITNHSHQLNGNTIFQNCHFSGAANPSNVSGYNSENNIGGDPMFMNPGSLVNYQFDVSGLELQSGSPLNGAGVDTSFLSSRANKDFNGKTRTTFNIGAF